MIGRCTKRLVTELAPGEMEHFLRYVNLDEVDLVIGREYLVFGVLLREGQPWFLVCEGDGDEYPKPHFSGLFEVIDNRIPPGWSLALGHVNAGPVAVIPESWAGEPQFMERLIDGERDAVTVFEEIKNRVRQWHHT